MDSGGQDSVTKFRYQLIVIMYQGGRRTRGCNREHAVRRVDVVPERGVRGQVPVRRWRRGRVCALYVGGEYLQMHIDIILTIFLCLNRSYK